MWLALDPFYAVMEVVRGPLLEAGAAPLVWLSALAYTVGFFAGSLALFVRFRSRIAFWVWTMARILAEAVTIDFQFYHVGARSLKKRLLARSGLRLRTDEAHRIVVSALRGLNSSHPPRRAGGADRP